MPKIFFHASLEWEIKIYESGRFLVMSQEKPPGTKSEGNILLNNVELDFGTFCRREVSSEIQPIFTIPRKVSTLNCSLNYNSKQTIHFSIKAWKFGSLYFVNKKS